MSKIAMGSGVWPMGNVMAIPASAAVFFMLMPTACSGMRAMFGCRQMPFSRLHFSHSRQEPLTKAKYFAG